MGSKSNRFEIYPLSYVNGEWTIPEEVLVGIWGQMVAEGKNKELFYDGTIKTPFEWMEFIKRPGTYPILVVEKKKKTVVHIAWLKDVFDIGAWAHHCSVGKYQRGAWEAVRDHWKKYFPSIKLVLGITPETMEKAIKFAEKICKFTIVGTIPLMCNLGYEGRRVGAIISYYEI
jgi:hypothetical protein